MNEKEYIRIPKTKPLPNEIIQLRKLKDEDWKRFIFQHLLRFYKYADFKQIKARIQDEKKKKRSSIEEVIKKFISRWLRCDQRFDTNGFIINREPSTDGKIDGYYDLKFEHSYWKRKYFPFECKNLDRHQASINEYVYNKSKNDGGVYRYLTGKYASNLAFGGMIGFILEGNENEIILNIINKIIVSFQDRKIEDLATNGITRNSIAGNHNTFDTVHLRQKSSKKRQVFILHHIIFDMT